MAITGLKTWTTSDALSTTNLNNDKAILEAKFNGGITTSDLSAAAGITNAQLANSVFELNISSKIEYTGAGIGLLAPNTYFFVLGGLPYDSAVETYTIAGIEHMLYLGTGAAIGAAVYTLKYGNHTDGFTTIKTGISTGTANGQTRESSFAVSTVATAAARPNFFILDVTTAGLNFAAGDTWAISIKLTKNLRA